MFGADTQGDSITGLGNRGAFRDEEAIDEAADLANPF